MLASFTQALSAKNKWNFDGTQFVCKEKGTGGLVCYAVRKEEAKHIPITGNLNGTLGIAIKWMHLGSAAGEAGPPFLLVAVPEMDADSFEVFETKGLTNTATIGQVGYLAFTQSSCGNKGIFNWFIKNLVVPSLVKSNHFHQCKVNYHKLTYL